MNDSEMSLNPFRPCKGRQKNNNTNKRGGLVAMGSYGSLAFSNNNKEATKQSEQRAFSYTTNACSTFSENI